MKDLDKKFATLIRLWVRRKLKQSEFVEMADWIGFRREAIHLACHQLSEREFNRTIGEAFFAAARKDSD